MPKGDDKTRAHFEDDTCDAGGKVMRAPKKICARYSDKEIKYLRYVQASFQQKMYKTLAEELKKYSAVHKASILSVCNHGAFRSAASQGNTVGMRFILEQMPEDAKAKLVEAISYRQNVAMRDFVEYCVKADLNKPETQALLKEGLQIFIAIDASITIAAMQDIAQEYTDETQSILTAAVGAATPHTAETSADPSESEAHHFPLALCIGAGSGGPVFIPTGSPFDPDDIGTGVASAAPNNSSGMGLIGFLGLAHDDNETHFTAA